MTILNPTSAEAMQVTGYLNTEIARQTKLLIGATNERDMFVIQGGIKALDKAKRDLAAPEGPKTEFSGPTYD